MKKKYFILPLICIMLILSIPSVHATNSSEVSDREMAIACALSYAPVQEGKKMSENFDIKNFTLISDVVNLVNGKINLHDFATIEEMDNWIVDDYHNKEISEKSLAVFTLRKDNNIIIAFRGTDFEALADVVYGITNYHNQEEYADKYVLEMLEKYSKMDGNYNIYVAGHSLGGYLAQTAGATIEQNISKYPNLRLARIVNFNGIGINFLTWLGDKINYGNQAETIATLKKLGEDGRLVEYYTYGDLVSALGVHYGEMRKLLPSIDSISYHRENNVVLANLNQKTNFGAKLEEIIKRDKLNIFKTEIHGAKKLYQLDESILAFLVLTHEADAFTTIDLDKSINKPEIKVVENQKGLIAQLTEGKTEFKIRNSITLKAITNYASVKKYEWYVSSDKENWELVSTSTVNINDPAYEENAKPTNLYTVDINTFESGETKYFKIVSYYDDNYVSSKYNKNSKTGQYEYIEQKEKSKNKPYKTEETIVQVTYKTKLDVLNEWVSSLINKNSYLSRIFKAFTRFTDFIKGANKGLSGILNIFGGDILSSSVDIVEKMYAALIGTGNFEQEPSEDPNNLPAPEYNQTDNEGNNSSDEKFDISSNDEKFDISDNDESVTDTSSYSKTHTDGNTYKLAVTESKLNDILNKIATESITQESAIANNYKNANKRSDDIATYHVNMLLGKVSNPTLEDCMSQNLYIGISMAGNTDNLRKCIDNKKVCRVHVQWKNGHWITCVGYKNDGSKFSDFLFLSSNTGELIVGEETQEANSFYSIQTIDAIRTYN